jgi:hypothetical protein
MTFIRYTQGQKIRRQKITAEIVVNGNNYFKDETGHKLSDFTRNGK